MDSIFFNGLHVSLVSYVAQLVKNPPATQEDLGSIPGLGRSPGEGQDYPLQYSCLESSMDCIVHGVTKSQKRLSDFDFLVTICGYLCFLPRDSLCVFTGNRHKEAVLMFKLILYFFLWFLLTFLYIFHENSLFWMCIMLFNVSISIYSIKVTLSTGNDASTFMLHRDSQCPLNQQILQCMEGFHTASMSSS